MILTAFIEKQTTWYDQKTKQINKVRLQIAKEQGKIPAIELISIGFTDAIRAIYNLGRALGECAFKASGL